MAKEATRNAYGKALAELVVERDDVLVLDADLTKSTKTIDAKKARPEHHFNMGIAEGNMMAVAAGMAQSLQAWLHQIKWFTHLVLRCLRQEELLNRFAIVFVIQT